jgi:hypothetical protein
MTYALDEKIKAMRHLMGSEGSQPESFEPPSFLRDVPTETTYNSTPVKQGRGKYAELEGRSDRNQPGT